MIPAACPICTPFRCNFAITIGIYRGRKTVRQTIRGCKHADVYEWVSEAEIEALILKWNRWARIEAEKKIDHLKLSDGKKYAFYLRLGLFLPCQECAEYQYRNQTDLPNVCGACNGFSFVDAYKQEQITIETI